MQDNYGNEITVENYVVIFSHATGIEFHIGTNHASLTSHADVDFFVRTLALRGYVDPVVLEWTDRTGTHCVADLP